MTIAERYDAVFPRIRAALLAGVALSVLVSALGLLALVAYGAGAAGLAGVLRQVLLLNPAGPDDIGLSLIALLGMAHLAAFMLALVGCSAREVWAGPLPWLIAAADVALLIAFGFTPGALLAIAAIAAGALQVRLWKALRINPVALKELRGRMRGARAFVVLTIYLTLMSAFAMLVYLIFNVGSSAASAVAGEIGRTLFISIVGIELLLMVFIAPALTSGAITGERERQTYDLLRTTLLSEPTFVLGKLESALAYLFMLLLAAIPLQSVAFLFGGVSEVEIALAFIVLAVTALALGAIGVTVSTGTDRTISASVRAYGLALALMFAVPLMASIGGEVMQRLLMPGGWTSPLMETAMAYVNTVLTAINPAAALLGTQQILIERNSAAFYPYTISSTGGTIPMVSPWVLFTVIYLTLSAVLIALAVRRMRQRDIQAA